MFEYVETLNLKIKMEEENWYCNLIEAVRGEKIIYEKKHPEFFNKLEKQKSWERVAAKVGRSKEECIKRWCLLREKFGKELRRRDFVSGSADNFSSDWPYFGAMNFLKEFIKNRRARCNEQSQENLVHEEENLVYVEEAKTSIVEEDSNLSSSTQIQGWTTDYLIYDADGASSGTKRKRKTSENEIENEIKGVLKQMKCKYQKDNVDEHFFRSIFSLMEEFGPKQKDDLRKKIFNLVMDARAKLYN